MGAVVETADGFRLSGSYWFPSIETTTQFIVHTLLLGYWGNIYSVHILWTSGLGSGEHSMSFFIPYEADLSLFLSLSPLSRSLAESAFFDFASMWRKRVMLSGEPPTNPRITKRRTD